MATTNKKNVKAEELNEAVEEKDEELFEGAEDNGEPESTEVAVIDSEDELDFEGLGYDLDELDGLSGFESINSSDIRVPFGKFWAVTKDGRTAGDIELPDGTIIHGGQGEVLEGLSILKPQTVRVMFPQPYKPTNTYICRSLDGKKGAEDGKYANTPCANCEFSVYPEDGGASPCREQILLLCTLEDNTLFHLLVSGMSVRDWKKQFLSVEMMKNMALVKKALKGKAVLAALNITVGVGEEKTKDFGMKPVIQFRVDKDQPLNSMARIKANLDAYSSYKEFEQEAVETAATFAQTEQTEYKDQDEVAGENAGIF